MTVEFLSIVVEHVRESPASHADAQCIRLMIAECSLFPEEEIKISESVVPKVTMMSLMQHLHTLLNTSCCVASKE